MKKYRIALTCLVLFAVSCEKNGDDVYDGLESETYTESTAVIANPERGIYSATECHSAQKALSTRQKSTQPEWWAALCICWNTT